MNSSLERELSGWNRRIRQQPNNPSFYVRRGMVQFKLDRIAASIDDFDRAEQLDPAIAPYLWQRGLSYYYADRFEDGVEQFTRDLAVNPNDAEEMLWRYLCLARSQNATAAIQSLPSLPPDPRPILRSIYALYLGEKSPADVTATSDRQGKQAQFYAHLYVGLYYEAEGSTDLARTHILKAAIDYPQPDYMWHLATVHRSRRRW